MASRRIKPSSLRYYLDGPPDKASLADWRLTLSGNGHLVSADLDEIAARCHSVRQLRRFVCVCNWSIAHEWDGYTLADILATFLDYTGDGTGLHLYQRGIGTCDKGKYDVSVGLQQALANNALLVVGIDGVPLALERGAPLRFVDFSRYGYKSVKGLELLEIRSEPFESVWENQKSYDPEGTVLPRRYNCVDLDATVQLALYGEQKVNP